MIAKSELQIATVQALKKLFGLQIEASDVLVQTTKVPYSGDLTIILFPYAKFKIGKLEEIGHKIGTSIIENTNGLVSDFDVVKGFLNITLSVDYWKNFINTMYEKGDSFFRLNPDVSRRIMVEYSSPNTNKPLHLGHLRNIFLGFSIAEILRQAGHTVIKANLINDRGIHICKSMLAYQRFGKGETPSTSNIKGDHLVGDYYVLFESAFQKEYQDWQKTDVANSIYMKWKTSETGLKCISRLPREMSNNDVDIQARGIFFKEEFKDKYFNSLSKLGNDTKLMLAAWEVGEPEIVQLWQTMNSWVYEGFDATYKKIGVDFDKLYYESNTYLLGKAIVYEGLKNNIFYKKADGSVWVDLTDVGLDNKLLLRSDGTSVYITQDLGTAQLKFDDYNLDDSLYVIGNEQDYHMKALKATMQKLSRTWANGIRHISYGMVELPSGRMKSREGTVVDADDLIAEMEAIARSATIDKGLIEGFASHELDFLVETIALGAIKFYLVKVSPEKTMVFNPEESIKFEGQTGVYIQYNHARISKIIRDAKEKHGLEVGKLQSMPPLHVTEVELLRYLSYYEEVLQHAAGQYDPALIANYVYTLTQNLGSFYAECRVLQPEINEEMRFRLLLLEQVRRTIKVCLNLLGIKAPDRM